MVSMLAWIAREAPKNQKAAYFAVMAAFTMSASNLATEYINKLFVIERGQFNELGMLMITVTILSLILPILAVLHVIGSFRIQIDKRVN